MGEAKARQLARQEQALEAMVVATPGGRIHVQWDHGASATPNAHAGQTTLYLTPMRAAKDKLMALIANVRAALSHVRAVVEQLPQSDRWKTFLDYVAAKITRPLQPWLPPNQLMATG